MSLAVQKVGRASLLFFLFFFFIFYALFLRPMCCACFYGPRCYCTLHRTYLNIHIPSFRSALLLARGGGDGNGSKKNPHPGDRRRRRRRRVGSAWEDRKKDDALRARGWGMNGEEACPLTFLDPGPPEQTGKNNRGQNHSRGGGMITIKAMASFCFSFLLESHFTV